MAGGAGPTVLPPTADRPMAVSATSWQLCRDDRFARGLRESLTARFTFWSTHIVRHTQAADGTEKLLLRLADGGDIECVLLRDGVRRTICMSSQVGCAMGCVFCASGLDGVKRNLTTAEILEQMLQLQRLLDPAERLSHLVVMGMGEPLANLDGLLPALELASTPRDWASVPAESPSRPSGLPPAIDRLARLQSPISWRFRCMHPTIACETSWCR